jgi:hypothetical protein
MHGCAQLEYLVKTTKYWEISPEEDITQKTPQTHQ